MSIFRIIILIALPIWKLTLRRDVRLNVVEVGLHISRGTNIWRHTRCRCQGRCRIPWYRAVLVVHVAPHSHILLELALASILPVRCSDHVLPRVTRMKLVHRTVREVLTLLCGVRRGGLPERPGVPHRTSHSSGPESTGRAQVLLRRVLALERRLPLSVARVLAIGVEGRVHGGARTGGILVSRLLAPLLGHVHGGRGVRRHATRVGGTLWVKRWSLIFVFKVLGSNVSSLHLSFKFGWIDFEASYWLECRMSRLESNYLTKWSRLIWVLSESIQTFKSYGFKLRFQATLLNLYNVKPDAYHVAVPTF